MSIINRTRKRLFSFSKPSGQDSLSEEQEPRTLDDSSLQHLTLHGRGSFGAASTISDMQAEEKRKPTSYVFLQIENPLRAWKIVDDFGNPNDEHDDDSYENEMVCRTDARAGDDGYSLTAACRVINKFSDDAFDDYLFEIGLLSVKHPRFDDTMAELELIKELDHCNVVKFIDVYYFESRLWVIQF